MTTTRAMIEVTATEQTALLPKRGTKSNYRQSHRLGGQYQDPIELLIKVFMDNYTQQYGHLKPATFDDIKVILKLGMLTKSANDYIKQNKDVASFFDLKQDNIKLLDEIYTSFDKSFLSYQFDVADMSVGIKNRIKFKKQAEDYLKNCPTRFLGYCTGCGFCNCNTDKSNEYRHEQADALSHALGVKVVGCFLLRCMIPLVAAFNTIVFVPSLLNATGKLAEAIGEVPLKGNATNSSLGFKSEPIANIILAIPFALAYGIALCLLVSACRSSFKFPYYMARVGIDKLATTNVDAEVFKMSSDSLETWFRDFNEEVSELKKAFDDLLSKNHEDQSVHLIKPNVSILELNGIFGRRPSILKLKNQVVDVESQVRAINV